MTSAPAPACGTDYSYTLGGKLATRTWARGIVTTYGYTPAGELALVDYADATPDVAYSYDRLGRQTQLTDSSGVRTFAYDLNTLRPVSETLAMSGAPIAVTLTRNRDAQGRYTGYALNRGNESLTSATYTFDAAGRIATADNVTFGYEPHTSRVQTLTHALADGKTLVSQTAFDGNRSALASVAHTVKAPGQADTLVSRIGYTTNALGQRTGVERSGTAWGMTQNVSYGYDPLGQVTSAQSTVPAETAAYAYDSIGNRLTSTEGGALASTYTANNLNQYTQVQGPQAQEPAYDSDGNMTTLVNSTGTWAMTWNGENRLVEMTKPDQRLVFAYDSMGRRWKKEVYTGSSQNWTLQSSHRYLYDGYVQITELNALDTYAPTRSYRWDPTVGEATRVLSMTLHGANTQTLAFTHDGNKNTDSLIAADGTLVGHYAYGPFGQVIAVTGSLAYTNPYRFSSEFEDEECGLKYYNYRYYAIALGFWLSRDSAGEIGDVNLYAIVHNNAISQVDRLGLMKGNLGVGVGGGATLFLPVVGIYSVGLQVSYSVIFAVAIDTNRSSDSIQCAVCHSGSVTIMGGVGVAANVSVGWVVTFGPSGDLNDLSGVSVGVGGGVGIPLTPGTLVGPFVELTVDVDIKTKQFTLNIPRVGPGVTGYLAVRITGQCTGCTGVFGSTSVRNTKLFDCLKNIQKGVSAVLHQAEVLGASSDKETRISYVYPDAISTDEFYGE